MIHFGSRQGQWQDQRVIRGWGVILWRQLSRAESTLVASFVRRFPDPPLLSAICRHRRAAHHALQPLQSVGSPGHLATLV
jgi:hypothetical protein